MLGQLSARLAPHLLTRDARVRPNWLDLLLAPRLELLLAQLYPVVIAWVITSSSLMLLCPPRGGLRISQCSACFMMTLHVDLGLLQDHDCLVQQVHLVLLLWQYCLLLGCCWDGGTLACAVGRCVCLLLPRPLAVGVVSFVRPV